MKNSIITKKNERGIENPKPGFLSTGILMSPLLKITILGIIAVAFIMEAFSYFKNLLN